MLGSNLIVSTEIRPSFSCFLFFKIYNVPSINTVKGSKCFLRGPMCSNVPCYQFQLQLKKQTPPQTVSIPVYPPCRHFNWPAALPWLSSPRSLWVAPRRPSCICPRARADRTQWPRPDGWWGSRGSRCRCPRASWIRTRGWGGRSPGTPRGPGGRTARCWSGWRDLESVLC